ncbi:hypothetical protein TNCV_1764801 [Trichonephila clavipes]|nr:hypothetical protein TNCV_1764801 [Trichonephila clavipes]
MRPQDASIGFKLSEFAGQARLTYPGALRTTHVHWQLECAAPPHCPAGRCHHPGGKQCGMGVDMVRKDRCVLVLIYRAFHNDQ